ncbi:hypothetical protein [Streptomyces sp. NPDC051576]|uniref:hypothetical protein n=1 Tax=Streptomyces sp. NPDC051576 TaxID=3155803 RepID=UPI003432C519
MATGNAMFPRWLDWLKRLPVTDGTRRSVPPTQDFSPLVQRAYADGEAAPAGWAEAMDAAWQRHEEHR